jgi:caa(3)-type oxidase subunit IV
MDNSEEPSQSGARYVIALILLLCLTALTFGLHYVNMGELSMAVALAIAAAKVTIVGLIFMELAGSSVAPRVVAAVTIGFVAVLCLGVFADVGFR